MTAVDPSPTTSFNILRTEQFGTPSMTERRQQRAQQSPGSHVPRTTNSASHKSPSKETALRQQHQVFPQSCRAHQPISDLQEERIHQYPLHGPPLMTTAANQSLIISLSTQSMEQIHGPLSFAKLALQQIPLLPDSPRESPTKCASAQSTSKAHHRQHKKLRLIGTPSAPATSIPVH